MNILDNDLVLKYFKCKFMMCFDGNHTDTCEQERSFRILDAMQQPIRKAERYLCIQNVKDVTIDEQIIKGDYYVEPSFHPFWIRLPDAFQKQEKDMECTHRMVGDGSCRCGYYNTEPCKPTRARESMCNRLGYG